MIIIMMISFASLDMHACIFFVQIRVGIMLAARDHVSDSSPFQSCIPDSAGMS